MRRTPSQSVHPRRLAAAVSFAALCAGACDSAPPLTGPTAVSTPSLDAQPVLLDTPRPRTGVIRSAGGAELAYRVVGRGRDTAIVLHGGPGLSMSYLVDDFDRLAAGRTLIFFDQRGGGHSPLALADSTTLRASQFVADIDAVEDYFGLRRATLIGHSWGATLAGIYTVARARRVDRLVLLDPGPIGASFGDAFQAELFSRLTPAELTRFTALLGGIAGGADPYQSCESAFALLFAHYQSDSTSLRRMRGHWCGGSLAGIRQGVLVTQNAVLGALGAYDLRPGLATALASWEIPTLIVYGDADPIPLANARAWAAAIPGAKLTVLRDAGHFPWLEDPKAFFTAVERFLRRR